MATPKKCKGTGRVKHILGCGNLAYEREFGLCMPCRNKWLASNDPEAQEYLLKRIIPKAKRKLETDKKEKTKADKESIKTKAYYEKNLQTLVNKIVRLIDINKGCISCSHGWNEIGTRQFHSGHFYSRGSSPSLRYNLFNIYKQCSICNNYLSGNENNFRKGLIRHYNFDVDTLDRSVVLKLNTIDLNDLISKCRTIIRNIENGKDYTRQEVNSFLGIYI